MTKNPVILDVHSPGLLVFGDNTFRCSLGPSGIVSNKHEGDGGTPVGTFPLKRVMYRPDRIDQPETALPTRALSENDGWCDDPDHADYNCQISLPHKARHEELWRDDHIYDVIVELAFNDEPPVPGNGSAIFLHVAREGYSPTQGCIALQIDDLLFVLKACGPSAALRVHPKTD